MTKLPKKLQEKMEAVSINLCPFSDSNERSKALYYAQQGAQAMHDELMPLIEEMAEALEKAQDLLRSELVKEPDRTIFWEITTILANYNKMKEG